MMARYNSDCKTWELRGKNIVLVAMDDDVVREYAKGNDKEYLAACAMLYGVEVQRLNFAMDALRRAQ